MYNNPDMIADLMNKLADARVTLNKFLSTLAQGDEPARREIAETLRQQIADRIEDIDVARLKVLIRITAEAPDPYCATI